MHALDIIFLGILQGLTEFLPVSSSGHLVLFQNLLGFKEPELLLDSALHFGTLVSVCVYFRSDLRSMVVEASCFVRGILGGKGMPAAASIGPAGETTAPSAGVPHPMPLLWWIFVGTIPTAFIGVVFKDPLESLFNSTSTVGFMLMLTGFILLATRSIPKAVNRREIGLAVALFVGIAQGLAIVPGISRSGTTIALGLMLGLSRDLAGRFSFLLSIPAITGAMALNLMDKDLQTIGGMPLLYGFASALLVGILALKLLMGVVRRGHLHYFAPYCWAVGILTLIATY